MLDFQKKKQLSILIQIARVDEDFPAEERAMIEKIGNRYGATQAEMDELFANSSISESLQPMSLTEKMDFMMDCILVVIADDVVTVSEEYFVRQMAARLGFRQNVVHFLIENKDATRQQMYDAMTGFVAS